MLKWFKSVFAQGPNLVDDALKQQGTVIDVRSAEEFSRGSVTGAMNIPHTEIRQHHKKIKTFKTPIIVCCASGMRSGLALAELKAMKVTPVVNGKTVNHVNAALKRIG